MTGPIGDQQVTPITGGKIITQDKKPDYNKLFNVKFFSYNKFNNLNTTKLDQLIKFKQYPDRWRIVTRTMSYIQKNSTNITKKHLEQAIDNLSGALEKSLVSSNKRTKSNTIKPWPGNTLQTSVIPTLGTLSGAYNNNSRVYTYNNAYPTIADVIAPLLATSKSEPPVNIPNNSVIINQSFIIDNQNDLSGGIAFIFAGKEEGNNFFIYYKLMVGSMEENNDGFTEIYLKNNGNDISGLYKTDGWISFSHNLQNDTTEFKNVVCKLPFIINKYIIEQDDFYNYEGDIDGLSAINNHHKEIWEQISNATTDLGNL